MHRIILALATVLALSACASTKLNENHKASVDAFARSQADLHVALQKLADATACNGDARCVENTKATAALALVGVRGGGGAAQVPVHVEQHHPAWGLAGSLLGGVVREAGATIRSEHARDQVLGQINGQTRTAEAAFELGAAAVAGASRTAEAYAGALPGLAPSISAEGSVYQGPTQIQVGDNAGRDNVRDGSQVGHSGPINTGTQNTGGVIGAGQVGNGRQNAPGPFGNIGPQCQGAQCQQGTPPVEPEPEG